MKKSPFQLTLLLALSLLGFHCQDRLAQTRSHLSPFSAWAFNPQAGQMALAQPQQAALGNREAGAHQAASLLLNDGDQWLPSRPTSLARPTKDVGFGNKPRDLTDSIKVATLRRCPLQLVVEGNKVTAVFGIGLAEVLDDVGDPGQKQGSAHPRSIERQSAPRPRVNTDLALAASSTPDLSTIAPLASTARDMAGSPTWNPSCHCENLGRRVVYMERALYLVDGPNQKLWVDLAGLNCTFCLDRIDGEFRITAENPTCATAFRCDAGMRCHW